MHSGFGELSQGGQFCAENARALGGNTVGSAALLGWERLNPTLLFQASNCPIQRSRAETCPAEARNVFDHRVSMLRSTGETGEHKQWRVRIVPHFRVTFGRYYASRTTHNVVIAQLASCRKEIQ